MSTSPSNPTQFETLSHLLKHALQIDQDGPATLILLTDGRLFAGKEDPSLGKVLWEEQDFYDT